MERKIPTKVVITITGECCKTEIFSRKEKIANRELVIDQDGDAVLCAKKSDALHNKFSHISDAIAEATFSLFSVAYELIDVRPDAYEDAHNIDVKCGKAIKEGK